MSLNRLLVCFLEMEDFVMQNIMPSEKKKDAASLLYFL